LAVAKQKCTKCGKDLTLDGNNSEFYKSGSELYESTGRLSICKNCVGKIFDRYFKKYEDNKLATYYMCRKLDICYNEASYLGALNEFESKSTPFWKLYMTKLNSLGGKNGASDSFDGSDEINKEELIMNKDIDINSEIIYFWGEGYSKEDYIYLEN